MIDDTDSALEARLRSSLGSADPPDFERWRAAHAESLILLNPVATGLIRRRRRWSLGLGVGSAMAAAILALVAVTLVWVPPPTLFAQAASAIQRAVAVTYTVRAWERRTSKDGQRTWLVPWGRHEWAYRAPDQYRSTQFDVNGKIEWVEIVDLNATRTLYLDYVAKRAIWKSEPSVFYGRGRKPFAWVSEVLEKQPIELVGLRNLKDQSVYVFRWQRPQQPVNNRSIDFWIDSETKRLVKSCDPGIDLFDPTTAPDRDHPAEDTFSKISMAGSISEDIVFDAQLDPALFEMTIPPGFEEVHEPKTPLMTEADLKEWLEVMARFNDNVFIESVTGGQPEHQPPLREKYAAADRKRKSERSETEQKFLDLLMKYGKMNRSEFVAHFKHDQTVQDSFRYLGKGVKFGDAERIVCWYRLKEGNVLRAVYGDLTIRTVKAEDLPLPVKE